jgi:nicotinamidase-related amidase
MGGTLVGDTMAGRVAGSRGQRRGGASRNHSRTTRAETVRSDRTAGADGRAVTDRSRVVLLLIDVINDLAFPGSAPLVRQAIPMARRLARLKARARQLHIPAIYINDNFGIWRSDFRRLVEHCVNDDVPGREVATLLQPLPDDYFVLKPKHSAFFGTTLDTLLDVLGADTLILTGIAGNICVLFSASDAYMRDFRLVIPRDCTVSNTRPENSYALKQMKTILKADMTGSAALDLRGLLARRSRRQA